jgi:hypothetical protein
MKCPSTVSTTLLLEAVQYYSELGYQLIDVPQCVDFDVSQHTKPEGLPELFHRGMKVYVASAEQSFLQLHKEGKLPNGKYMALTPCYRHEATLDDTHYSLFLKLELVVVGESCSYNVMHDCLGFFKPKIKEETYFIVTDEGIDTYDIMCDDVEIGSYGVRYTLDGTPYTYGTGIAEPRFSSLL